MECKKEDAQEELQPPNTAATCKQIGGIAKPTVVVSIVTFVISIVAIVVSVHWRARNDSLSRQCRLLAKMMHHGRMRMNNYDNDDHIKNMQNRTRIATVLMGIPSWSLPEGNGGLITTGVQKWNLCGRRFRFYLRSQDNRADV